MSVKSLLKRGIWALALAATFGLAGTADAQRYYRGGYYGGYYGGGISPGAAVGLGLGSFALGAALGSGAFARPYYPYPYPYYAPAPVYYAPPPPVAYRTCWYPQFGGYYAC